ncbi:hypothetical protein MKQ70_16620 [Chitinophaga sedimenti]|uniref:hypothetical protein n=1 Tax=Chitinophaga sedimenti TaxID=2033606 RepID=UPI002006242E|nr:hypothetical protein [Chitinophaga sedimenti]MCK7556552.1 hypothetical protein [Chitinophaga sedimenti]
MSFGVKDYYQLKQEREVKKYFDLLDTNSHCSLVAIIDWFVEQTKLVVIDDQLLPTIEVVLTEQSQLFRLVQEADNFYRQLFISNCLFGLHVDGNSMRPVRYVLGEFYKDLTGHQNFLEDDNSVTFELKRYCYSLLSKKLAQDKRFYTFDNLYRLVCLYRDHAFYHNLIKELPQHVIVNIEQSLSMAVDAADPRSGFAFFQAPGHLDANFCLVSPSIADSNYWELLQPIIRDARNGGTAELLSFKRSLVLRLPSFSVGRWLCDLRWPLAQAIILNDIDDLQVLRDVLSFADTVDHADCSNRYLPLLILNRYWELTLKVSFSLDRLSQAVDPQQPEIGKQIAAAATSELATWKQEGLKVGLAAVLRSFVAKYPVKSAGFFKSLFDWVAHQDNSRHAGTLYWHAVQSNHILLREEFSGLFEQGLVGVDGLLSATKQEGFSWMKAELLIAIEPHAEHLTNYRDEILRRMLEFVESKEFCWNTGIIFNEKYVTEANCLAYLLYNDVEGDVKLSRLVSKHELFEQGWGCSNQDYAERVYRYAYLLTSGISLSLMHFRNENVVRGTAILNFYISTTTRSYRNSVSSLNMERYITPLELAAHILVKYKMEDLNRFVSKMYDEIDDIVHYVSLMTSMIRTASGLDIVLPKSVMDRLQTDVKKYEWVLDASTAGLNLDLKFKALIDGKREILNLCSK